MECNKDEARRALDIAEKKLSENDYVGAKKFVNKAQNLYPKLDGLKQVLMMIHVYISASKNGKGGEVDWYGVLGVDPLADDEALKKQYKKLALLLHPDKNKCKGAEGAFKLVSEALCLLSDKVKRIDYDQKRKSKTGMQKPPNPHKPASNNGNRNADVDPSARARSNKPAGGMQRPPPNPHKPTSSGGNQNVKDGVDPSAKATSNKPAPAPADSSSGTFWTMCNKCKTQCAYTRDYRLNKVIVCPNCGYTFIATETSPWPSGVRPVPNFSSSSPQQQQQRSAQNKAANKNTNGASSSRRNSSPSASAAQKTPQASAKNTNEASSSSPFVNATAKTPQASGVRPVPIFSSSPQQQRQWSAQNQSTNTNGASSSPSVTVSATAKTPLASGVRPVPIFSSSPQQQQQQQQWSAQNQSTNRNTNGTSSLEFTSPSFSVTVRTPQGSFGSPVINVSSSSQLQQQWSTQNQSTSQNTSGGTHSESTYSASTVSTHWHCSISVTTSSNGGNTANQAQERSKRVVEESQETTILKKQRTDVK